MGNKYAPAGAIPARDGCAYAGVIWLPITKENLDTHVFMVLYVRSKKELPVRLIKQSDTSPNCISLDGTPSQVEEQIGAVWATEYALNGRLIRFNWVLRDGWFFSLPSGSILPPR